MRAIIECGANRGQDSEQLAFDYFSKYPDCQLFLFEPTRELLAKFLYPKFDKTPRVNILPFAVDIENSFKEFNVTGWDDRGFGDWGCSSLHKFSDNIHDKWPDRTDFEVSHSYRVPTIKLKTVCEMYNITDIIYLWCDTQGNDFNVLKSLEDKIGIVWEGRIEVADEVDLYKDVNNRLEDAREFLKNNDFETFIHSHGKEADIHFLNRKQLPSKYEEVDDLEKQNILFKPWPPPDAHFTF